MKETRYFTEDVRERRPYIKDVWLRSRPTPLLNAMQLRHYPETDTLYVAFREAVSVESEEVSPGVVADFDEDGRVIGFEVEDASNQMDLSSLQAFSLPANALGLLLGAGVVLL